MTRRTRTGGSSGGVAIAVAALIAGVMAAGIAAAILALLIGASVPGTDHGCGSASAGTLGPPGTSELVGATEYGGPGDPSSGVVGASGANLLSHPDSYAELGGESFQTATAIGGLPYLTPLRITWGGRSAIAYKRDIGLGGGPVGGLPREIDLWWLLADRARHASGRGCPRRWRSRRPEHAQRTPSRGPGSGRLRAHLPRRRAHDPRPARHAAPEWAGGSAHGRSARRRRDHRRRQPDRR